MVTQLQVYNLALLKLKQSNLAVITEDIEARYALDDLWDQALKVNLECGYWKFAMRTVSITEDTTIVPEFGYELAFNKPSDWAKTYFVTLDEHVDTAAPFNDWSEETGLFFCDSGPLYVRYVSNSSSGYGYDLSVWPGLYTDTIACWLAWQGAGKIAGSSDAFVTKLEEDYEKAKSKGLTYEALREPPKMLPEGRWNRGRFGSRGDSRRGLG